MTEVARFEALALTREQRIQAVEEAIIERRSMRAFTEKPVERQLVERILTVAARAPSNTNIQPWRALVLAGAEKDRLCKSVVAAHYERSTEYESEYRFYPNPFFEPYLSRRREVGWELYGLLGIKRGEDEKIHAQHGRNFLFFDAPVGILFTIDRRLGEGSWIDYGMFLQNILIVAEAHGLHTCAQGAFATYHKVIRKLLPVTDSEIVMCGVSLGYANEAAPENTLKSRRAGVAEFAAFFGF